MASTPAPRGSARARRLPPRLADCAMAPTSARRRTARAPRPLPQPADRAAATTSASAGAPRRSFRGPAAQTVLPDEIWEDIFLRLDAAADLARSSAACSSFRRIVSEHRFLRRFRSLHSPPVLGFITCTRHQRFIPVGPPHRSAPEARALELAADFTFSFLPDHIAWCVRHARDGRVLLSQPISTEIEFEDFLVCDPLHRRYVMIPRIPDDLMASTADNGMTRHVLAILAPARENDEEESFRVIYTVQHKGKRSVMAFVFSSCNQTWQAIISTICLPDGVMIESMNYYAHGCLYWMVALKNYSLMLDTSEMKFSITDLPPHNLCSKCAIVEAEAGRLRFLTIGDSTIDLYCKNWQRNGVGAQEWQHVKLIPLPNDSGIPYIWDIEGTGSYLALVAHQVVCDESLSKSEYFVMDIKTLLVEKLCTSNNAMLLVFLMQDFYHHWHCQSYEMVRTKTLLVEKLCTSNNAMLSGFPYARFLPPLALPSL